jgi:hypothetical protein
MTTSPGAGPTWEPTIRLLFAAPYWIEEARRDEIARGWHECMSGYGIDLADYGSVRQWAVTIYDHLASRAMPLTTDDTQFWPEGALEQLGLWVDEGCRKSTEDPIVPGEVIPRPTPRRHDVRVRKDILDLTQEELNHYRARLEKLDITSAAANSAWQQLAYIHTNWCLHYQESFLLWHRANLLYFEDKVGLPIPYWDFMSPEVTRDGSPHSGLPEPFKELTYTHPETGEERPNPLRFAVAKDGRSKVCAGEDHQDTVDGTPCRYVHRDPVLYTTGDDHRREREEKLQLVEKFQSQVRWAFHWPVFSTPEGVPGYPWANIQTFNPPPPDSDYPHRCDFDGLYEQPHDNFHGWIGPDMADNSYTAFDPIFWSYHANIDRIFEEWKRDHPGAMFTATFPIRPFIGPEASEIDFTDPDPYDYTTIGDMARDSRALGYDYAAPHAPDLKALPTPTDSASLYVVFGNVKCIRDTYTIDIFLNLPAATAEDKHGVNGRHYVGRLTRLGMGVDDDKGRCRATGVTRVLDASDTVSALGLTPESPLTLSLVVTDITQDAVIPPEEYADLPGFHPVLRWGGQVNGEAASAGPPAEEGRCH